MEATQILIEEHRLILKVLQCLDRLVAQAESTGKPDGEAARSIIDFIRNFADKTHHAKEEDRLFVEMENAGFPREGGPTGVMLHEHDIGRDLVRRMEQALQKIESGDRAALPEFARSAREFIALLEAHIEKENQVLFPMADQSLPASVHDQLLKDFQQIEQQAGGDRHAKYYQQARELCEKFGVPFLKGEEWQTIRNILYR